MNNIPSLTPGDNNVGSLREILFVPVTEVDRIKAPVDGLLEYDALQFNNAAAPVYLLRFTEETARYRYEQVKGPQGPLFRIKISCQVPKDYNFRGMQFEEMQNLKFFVITRDNNNRNRLHGYINAWGEKYGLTFSEDFDTGNTRSNYNGFSVAFEMDSIRRPQNMEDITDTPIDPGFPIPEPDDVPPPIDPGTE